MQDENTNPTGDPTATDGTIGTPEEDIGTWDGKQNYDDTCAIRCQEFILEQFTGQEVSEDALVQQAQANGWYQPGGGTMPEDMGNLLEANGVATTGYVQGATPHDLANELAQGHKVIIGVDSGELWGEDNPIMEDIASIAPVDGADHAVVISGIDTTDPNNPQVIISDPGNGDAAATYPMDQFVAAWQDSNFEMVATEDPVPPTSPEMVNFDYEEGHISEVMGMPYEEFVELNDNLDRFNELLEEILITIGVEVPPDDGQDADGVDQAVVDGDAALDPDVLVDQTVVDEQDAAGQTDGDATSQEAVVIDQLMDQVGEVPGGGRPVEVNISDVNIQVNEGDGTFAPEETGDVLTPGDPALDPAVPTADPTLVDDIVVEPGPPIDIDPTLVDQGPLDPAATPVVPPELLDPAAPGPTLPPELLDPTAPGPTLPPELLDPVAPGPTLDPILFDPNAPGPNIDPAILDPEVPGPTFDPILFDPNAPGPTLDPEILDPAAPGPTLPPELLDPAAPGPTLDPAVFDPMAPGPTLDPATLDPAAPDSSMPAPPENGPIDADPDTPGVQELDPAIDPLNPGSVNSPWYVQDPSSPFYIDLNEEAGNPNTPLEDPLEAEE